MRVKLMRASRKYIVWDSTIASEVCMKLTVDLFATARFSAETFSFLCAHLGG